MTTDNFVKHTSKNPFQRYLIDIFFAVLIKEVEHLNPNSILDVGCGEGFTLEKLRKREIGERLEGVDVSITAIEIGVKLHPKLALKKANIYNLPYGDNSFDLVVCSEVLEHLEEPVEAAKELRRVAKKYCIISVPNEPIFRIVNFLRGKNLSRWGNDIEHIQHWSSRGIVKFVTKYFEVKKVRNPFPWTIVIAEKHDQIK